MTANSATPARIFAGRRRESAVWQYFRYDKEIKKIIFQVLNPDGKTCSYPVSQKNTTNLKSHLQRNHGEQYELFVKTDTDNKALKKESGNQI